MELRENQDFFQEIYPDSDDDSVEDSEDEDERGYSSPADSDDEFAGPASHDLKEVKKEIQSLVDGTNRAAEVISSAENRVKLLDDFVEKVEIKSGSDMGDIMQTYLDHRNKTFEDYMEGSTRLRELEAKLKVLRKKERKLNDQAHREKMTASKAARKERQAKLKQLDLKNRSKARESAEKARIQQERCRFWPRYCYLVRITLDATQYTPISRRSSISSVTDLVKPATEDQGAPVTDPDAPDILNCDLSISYVTSEAYWSASYDLQLSTTSNTGTLFFDAQLVNHTSESWRDCKVVLFTSQAIFSGLRDAIPELHPWHIKLGGESAAASDGITSSRHEIFEQRRWKAAVSAASRVESGKHFIGISSPAQTGQNHGQVCIDFFYRPAVLHILSPTLLSITLPD